jgi:aspartyl-tRNA(Asn)/glutamyl-tRNA(Gln) amidotransferase subunit C
LDGENMKITRENVEAIAKLARLEIPAAEIEDTTKQLDDFLEYAAVLGQLDTSEIQPTAHVLPLQNVMRLDETRPSLPREEALLNAPEQEDRYFKVPKVMED